MNGQKPVIFRGNLLHCLLEYGNRLPKNRIERKAARQALCHYTGTGDKSVHRWLTGQAPPYGEKMLRCMYFLQQEGFVASELEAYDPQVYLLGKLIAEKVVSFDEAYKGVGYTNRDSLFAIFRGQENPGIDTLERWNDFLQAYSEDVDMQTVAEDKGEEEIEYLYDQRVDPLRHRAAIDVFVHQILAMLPLAEYLISDKFSDEERRRLREMIPNDGLFVMAQALNGLCSRKSREMLLAQGLFRKKEH